eukprot:m.231540 g.231540  ORF g.231540 m.231540 type:complete len:327 (-) comp18398_c0_seq1:37-1017(-)
MVLVEVSSAEDFRVLVERGRCVVHFAASWAPQCAHMNDILSELSNIHTAIKFVKVEAENVPEIAMQHQVTAVPTFVFLKDGKAVSRVDGANAASVTDHVEKLSADAGAVEAPAAHPAEPKQDLNTRLQALVSAAPVMLFMKGTVAAPRCGFSREAVALLQGQGVEFSTFDILADDEVRQGLKAFSNWPTYPQLYANGTLVGGLDIMKELVASGELTSALPAKPAVAPLQDRLRALITQAPVVLFMKGTPDTPRCGFSSKIVALLRAEAVPFASFDILSDEEVRQGLKEFSNWPTYPQLYANGNLVGGLDIAVELQQSGELKSTLGL